MIKIADNPAVRDQVKNVSPEASPRQKSTLKNAPEPVTRCYPVVPLLLENGRYYIANTEK